MKILYCLCHVYRAEDGEMARKFIGTYSSPDKANAAIDELKTQTGFVKYPDGFRIVEFELDKVPWPDGVKDVDAFMAEWHIV